MKSLYVLRFLIRGQNPEYDTPTLAAMFKVSPEAIRRILKSRWEPNEEEQERRAERWEKRGEKIWTRWRETGVANRRRSSVVRPLIWARNSPARPPSRRRASMRDEVFDPREL